MKDEMPKPKKEGKAIKSFLVILPSGDIKRFEELGEESRIAKIIVNDELGKKEVKEGEPSHIGLAKRLEIAEKEPASDAGCHRFYPKGAFIKQLIRDLAWQRFVVDNGACPIGTPILFRKDDPGVFWLINHFPERHYKAIGGKGEKNVDLFMKTAGDYGSFSILRDAQISHKNMPLALYEDEMYDHRYEQRGEIRGMYRVRCFEMHNVHTICRDERESIDNWKKWFDAEIGIFDEIGFRPDAFIFFCLERLYGKEHEAYLREIAKRLQRPVVIELLEEVTVYMSAWIDFLVLDSLDRPMEIGTSQIDSFSSENWKIKFKDQDNSEVNPLIIHSGFSSERAIAGLLEYLSRGKSPMLPLWLSPVQVRLCPINDSFLDYCKEIAGVLEKSNIRVDIDDNGESLEKKVRNAEMEWVPFIVAIGKREKESGMLSVRSRSSGELEQLKMEDLLRRINDQVVGKPFKPLPIPRLLSLRPKFS
jgi:threonyl-tRNA synthetase